MNELKKELEELDKSVWKMIRDAKDRERAENAYQYYMNGQGNALSLVELGIAESIKQHSLEPYYLMREAFKWESFANEFGNLSLTEFCIHSGLYAQFFHQEHDATHGAKHIYVLRFPNESVKVGIAVNVDRRIAQIQSANGMQVIERFETDLVEDAHIIEHKVHKKFSTKRKKGEYFEINFQDAVDAVKEEVAKAELQMIRSGIEAGLNYKEIYKVCKERCVQAKEIAMIGVRE